jgi:hypothetical protein
MRKNQGEHAKALTVPEQWDRIDQWTAKHTIYNCPVRTGHYFDGEIRGFVAKSVGYHCDSGIGETVSPPNFTTLGELVDFYCEGKSGYYCFMVSNVEYKRIGDIWVIVNWEKICETRDEKLVCE